MAVINDQIIFRCEAKHKKKVQALAKKKKVAPAALYREMLEDYIKRNKNK